MTVLRPVVYDAGMLIAAERSQTKVWRAHRTYLTAGGVPQVPAPVVAQVWRDGDRQARLAQLLKGCDVAAMDETSAREVGELLGQAGTSDPVDGAVAVLAARLGAAVATSDPDDIRHLLDRLGSRGKLVSLQQV
ncbi:twitching motility protein PilT [Streptomyces sp. ME19-01-6]|uniref:twitching motility protein PilT n=1 Tax=Streptomyces sp. ME19-01-6 TaxID=3028686 RepID=UPI0029A4860E|nr:twitching motility protein PilT [Streptomyces sp. ME19-01-6]MDX3225808.1 twitching motility protein PilT [Streptomyces sp. ME19-01-6]